MSFVGERKEKGGKEIDVGRSDRSCSLSPSLAFPTPLRPLWRRRTLFLRFSQLLLPLWISLTLPSKLKLTSFSFLQHRRLHNRLRRRYHLHSNLRRSYRASVRLNLTQKEKEGEGERGGKRERESVVSRASIAFVRLLRRADSSGRFCV